MSVDYILCRAMTCTIRHSQIGKHIQVKFSLKPADSSFMSTWPEEERKECVLLSERKQINTHTQREFGVERTVRHRAKAPFVLS